MAGLPPDVVDSNDVCQLVIPASSSPIWTIRGNEPALSEQRNNSTRAVPDDDRTRSSLTSSGTGSSYERTDRPRVQRSTVPPSCGRRFGKGG